jgi:hypothetical protein
MHIHLLSSTKSKALETRVQWASLVRQFGGHRFWPLMKRRPFFGVGFERAARPVLKGAPHSGLNNGDRYLGRRAKFASTNDNPET